MRIRRSTCTTILLAAFVLGVIVAIRVPPMAAHDEIYHWMRVVQISEGHLFPERVGEEWGGAVDAAAFRFDIWLFERFLELQPIKLADVWGHANELASVSSERVVVPFSSTATFSPLAYLPQALGVLVARSVGANLLIQVLAGRLFNLAAYISMLAIIARTLPVGNAIFFGLSLVPSALYLAASLSADPINFTIPAALFAICLRYRDSPHNVMASNGWMQVAALTAAVGLLKIVCVVFAGAPLLIPWQRFGSKRNKSLFLIGAIGTSLLLCAAWNVTHPFDPERTWHASITPGGLTFLIEEPLHTAGILLQTIPKLCLLYWSAAYEQIGGIVGFDQIAPVWAALPTLSMIVLLAISEGRRRDFAAAAILTFLASAFAGLLLLAFLLTFTPPNATMILGVQGRYFFMFFMLLGWAATRLGLAGPRLTKLCPALLAATLIMNACFLIYAVRFFDNLWIF